MVKFTPVDHDPFAASPGPKLTPVEGDPFATPPSPAAQNISGDYKKAIEPNFAYDNFTGGLQAGTQAVGAGLANVAGAPVDIMTMIINGLSGITNLAGEGVEGVGTLTGNEFEIPDIPPIRNPLLGGDDIRDTFSKMFEAMGGHVIQPHELSPQQRFFYGTEDFATQGATGGAGLLKAGITKGAPALIDEASSFGKTLADAIPNYITNPYKAAPNKMLIGDAAAGAGSGTALAAADEYLPEHMKIAGIDVGSQSPITRFLAAVLGGGAGAGTADTIGRLPKEGITAVTDRLPAPAAFQDPNAMAPVSNRTVDQAVSFVHGAASNPQTALAQLMDEMAFYAEAGGAPPTTGLMTDDTGLQLTDRKMRDQNPKPFMERDRAVRDSAFNDVENLRPDGANPELPRQVSEAEISARTNAATDAVKAAQKNFEGAQQSETQLGDIYAQPPMNAEEASIALDDALVNRIGIPMRSKKGDLYRSVDPEGTEMVDTAELVSLAKQLENAALSYPPSTRGQMAPEGLISDIKAYEPRIDPKSGENIGGPGVVSFKNLNEWRKPLSEMENSARRNGQIGIADAIMKIRKAIGGETEALAASGSPAGERAAEANRFYKEDYKPFREGPVGDLMKDVARNPQRDKVPPSATASRVLVKGPGAPEAGANVNAALDRAAPPVAAAGREAIKNYFLSDLRNVVRDGKVQETRLAAWIKNNESTLNAYPEFKKEVTNLLGDVRGRSARTSQLRTELETAQAGKAQTEKDLAKSGFAIFAGREPEKAVQALFSADDPVAAVRQLKAKFAGNKEAEAGLRAMVADHLIDQVKTSGKAGVSGDSSPLSLAKIESTFRRNEKLLNEVFGSDVKYLNQARKRLEALSRRAGSANVGSTTVERAGVDRFVQAGLRPVEIAAKLVFGQLQGGGYTRSAKLLAQSMPDSTAAAWDLVMRMQFDPVLAKHILEATPKTISPAWSKRLNRLMGWAEAGRASGRDDSEEKQ